MIKNTLRIKITTTKLLKKLTPSPLSFSSFYILQLGFLEPTWAFPPLSWSIGSVDFILAILYFWREKLEISNWLLALWQGVLFGALWWKGSVGVECVSVGDDGVGCGRGSRLGGGRSRVYVWGWRVKLGLTGY